MPTITIKNIPDELYERLKQSAAENRRSINSEVIVCIERAVHSRKVHTPDEILAKARELRKKTSAHSLTDEEFTQRKAVGRL
ncbi:MAG: Arc family DNA-binding protein [Deltaproteobacteria bacterium]|nr:Arc family DNA-binding protein [Deltaproteobacteria bacterium]